MDNTVMVYALNQRLESLKETPYFLGHFDSTSDGIDVVNTRVILDKTLMYKTLGFVTFGKKVLIQRGHDTNGYIATVWNIETTEAEHPRLKFGPLYTNRLNASGLEYAGYQVLPFIVAGLPVTAFMETLDHIASRHIPKTWDELLTLTGPGMRILERELIGEYQAYLDRRRPPQFATNNRRRVVATDVSTHEHILNRMHEKLAAALRKEVPALNENDTQVVQVSFDEEDQEQLDNGDLEHVTATLASVMNLVPGEYSFKILDHGTTPAPGLISSKMHLFVIFRRTQ